MQPRSLRQLLKDVVPVNQQFRQRGGTHGTGLDVGPGQLVLLVRAERVGQNGLLAGVGDPILPNVVFGVQVESVLVSSASELGDTISIIQSGAPTQPRRSILFKLQIMLMSGCTTVCIWASPLPVLRMSRTSKGAEKIWHGRPFKYP